MSYKHRDKKELLVRYRNPLTDEVYIKNSSIEPRSIDGVEFLPVQLEAALGTAAGRIVWMKKDQLVLIR